jgi:predicted nucleic acid-binding protein
VTPQLYKRPYLDASVWTSALDSADGDHEVARAVLDAADRGEFPVVVSSLMELEVVGGTHNERTDEAAKRALLALRSSRVIVVTPVPRINDEARRLRLDLNLDTLDAIHLATAIYAKADVFLTSDKALLRKARGHVPIEMSEPYWLGTMPFPLDGQD